MSGHYQKTAECDAYYNHVFSCTRCNAGSRKYCEEGWPLYEAYIVAGQAESIMKMQTRVMRNAALQRAHPRARATIRRIVEERWGL